MAKEEMARSFFHAFSRMGDKSRKEKRCQYAAEAKKILFELKKSGYLCRLDYQRWDEYLEIISSDGENADHIANLKKEVAYWQSDDFASSVVKAKGVGVSRAGQLSKLGIETVYDLFTHYPKRYEDRSKIRPMDQVTAGEYVTVAGTVKAVKEKRVRKNLFILEAEIYDEQGWLKAVWFNQMHIKKQLKTGKRIFLSGKVNKNARKLQIQNPDYELEEAESFVHTGQIVPVYPATEKVEQKRLRRIIKDNFDIWLDHWKDPLPAEIRKKYQLMEVQKAMKNIHFPESKDDYKEARRRLIFEELLILQLGVNQNRYLENHQKSGRAHLKNCERTQKLLGSLSFSLTKDQKKASEEIWADMERPRRMNRLLQGDVGSGKTIVAVLALTKTVDSGCQGVFMAPTEVLAEQHFHKTKPLFEKAGIRSFLLTGSLSEKEKQCIYDKIKQRKADIVIGTHALFQEKVSFDDLGLAVIDEQHRFGVQQRNALRDKGLKADILVMSATPIPRTLAMTAYGDLDITTIKQMPAGRKPIKTYSVTSDLRPRVHAFIRKVVQQGQQVYVVCPLIEGSDHLNVQAANDLAATLKEDIFPDLAVGLLHGKMINKVKEKTMQSFNEGSIDILVATTVVEVGVDVANASLIVIEGAERFGLAQLHQLRGRVGRGEKTSYCVLINEGSSNEEASERMKIMCATQNGFLLAEKDLVLRGPGEYLGTKQHGLPDLKLADLLKHQKVLQIARKEAVVLLKKDPDLSFPEHSQLAREVNRKMTPANFSPLSV